jgi:type IV secretion system protein VirD4
MDNEFLLKQKQKFNLKYDFHDVFIMNGWHGNRLSYSDVIPYDKYTLDDGTKSIIVNVISEKIFISSIDNENDKRYCQTPFDCYVHLVTNENEFEAAKQIADQIPDDNNEPFNVNVLEIEDMSDVINVSPFVISPIDGNTYNDKSVQRLVPSDALGSARWKTIKEIRASGLISNEGIPLGLIENENHQLEKFSYTGEKHLLTIAPSGTGKNTAVQIPVLLQYDASIFCIDPKGENALVTAKYRKEVMGHDVVVINPFGVYLERFEELGIKQVGFNPLASLNPDAKDFVTQVDAICHLLIEPEGNDPFWSNAARELVSCFIMYICKTKPPSECNLIEVRRLLMQDVTELLTITLPFIAKDDFEPMAEKAKSFSKVSKTIDNIVFTAKIQMGFLHDSYLIDNLSVHGEKSIDFNSLKKNKHKNVTVYLVVPIDRISNYQKWFRMLLHTSLTVLRSAHITATKQVLVMIDECKAIGYLREIEDSLAYSRGFGIQMWCFFQNYEQIKSLYPNSHEFFSNAAIQQFFTVNDYSTAEWISKRIGNKTVLSTSATYSWAGEIQSFSQSEVGTSFLESNELFGLDMNYQILLCVGYKNPMRIGKDFYFKNPIIKNRADFNPYAPQ